MKTLCLFLAALFSSLGTVLQEARAADTPAHELATAFFAAYAASDAGGWERFVTTYDPPGPDDDETLQERARDLARMHDMLGELEVEPLEVSGTLASARARSSALGAWVRFELEVSSEAPYRMTELRVKPSRPPGAAQPGPYRDWADLGELLERVRADARTPAIALGVATEAGVIHVDARGLRRVDGDARVTPGDRFHFGSITKAFTATLAAVLAEQGTVDLEVTLGETFPELEMRPEYASVRLLDLLHHRAGFPHSPEPEVTGGVAPEETTDAILRWAFAEEPAFEPGTGTAYSNTGYVVAAAVLEELTGDSWLALLRRHVLSPMELASVDATWPTDGDADQPSGHRGAAPELEVQEPGEPPLAGVAVDALAPAGHLSGSARDLARFASFHLRALRGRAGITDADTLAALHDPLGVQEGRRSFAAGWAIERTPSGSELHWSNGSATTFFAYVAVWPEEDLAVALLTNSGLASVPWIEALAEAVHERVQAGGLDPSWLGGADE